MYCFIMAPWPFATKIGSGDRHLLSSLSASAWSKRPHQKHNLVAFICIHGATHEVNIRLKNNRWRKHIGGFTKCVCLLTIPFETNHTGFEILLSLLCLKKKYISTYVYAVSLMFVALVPSQNLSFTEVTPRRPSFFDRNKNIFIQPSLPSQSFIIIEAQLNNRSWAPWT